MNYYELMNKELTKPKVILNIKMNIICLIWQFTYDILLDFCMHMQ